MTAVIVFIGTFALSTGLVWLFVGLPETKAVSIFEFEPVSNGVYADDIESLLDQDIANGYGRSSRIFTLDNRFSVEPSSASFADYAGAVEDYADDSGSIDANDLPRDFQKSWNKHMRAWREYSNFLDKINNSSSRKKISDRDFDQMESSFNRDINSSWYEVLRVGAKYGVDVEQYK